MVESYKKIVEKIKETEKQLKSAHYPVLSVVPDKPATKRKAFVQEDTEVIEDLRSLKENITESTTWGCKLAYQQVAVENTKWHQKDH